MSKKLAITTSCVDQSRYRHGRTGRTGGPSAPRSRPARCGRGRRPARGRRRPPPGPRCAIRELACLQDQTERPSLRQSQRIWRHAVTAGRSGRRQVHQTAAHRLPVPHWRRARRTGRSWTRYGLHRVQGSPHDLNVASRQGHDTSRWDRRARGLQHGTASDTFTRLAKPLCLPEHP